MMNSRKPVPAPEARFAGFSAAVLKRLADRGLSPDAASAAITRCESALSTYCASGRTVTSGAEYVAERVQHCAAYPAAPTPEHAYAPPSAADELHERGTVLADIRDRDVARRLAEIDDGRDPDAVFAAIRAERALCESVERYDSVATCDAVIAEIERALRLGVAA